MSLPELNHGISLTFIRILIVILTIICNFLIILYFFRIINLLQFIIFFFNNYPRFTLMFLNSGLFYSWGIVCEWIVYKSTANWKTCFWIELLTLSMPTTALKLPFIDRIVCKKFSLPMILVVFYLSNIFFSLFNNSKLSNFFTMLVSSLIYNVVQEINLYSHSILFFVD